MMANQQITSISSDEKHEKKQNEKNKKESKELKYQEEKQKRDEAKRQKEEEVSAKRGEFHSQMSNYSAYSLNGKSGSELQIIVNENWNYLDYREKQNFVINTAQTLADCGLAGTITTLTFRFTLDGRKLAIFDSSNGARVYR